MLNLKRENKIIGEVYEGSAFSLPSGDVVSPAYEGWSNADGYSLEKKAPVPAPTPEELLLAEREAMRLSFAQLLIGLVDRQWISEDDGTSWLSGTLPATVIATINLLPAGDRFAATAKCLRPSYVYRLDQIVLMMAKVRGVSDEDVDALFRDYASR